MSDPVADLASVEHARAHAAYREGVLAAYRSLGRHDLVASIAEAITGLDRLEPEHRPSLDRCSVLPSLRRAPDGTLIDLARPFADRDGETWHWAGYGTCGQPLISTAIDSGYVVPIGEIYEQAGPFTQAPPVFEDGYVT